MSIPSKLPPSPHLEDLSPEILERIFYPAQRGPKAIIEMQWQLLAVSKRINACFRSAINHRIYFLKEVGCTTGKKAVQYIFDYKLPFARLNPYRNMDNEDLKNLSKCTELKLLILPNGKFTEARLIFTLGKLKSLQTLGFCGCDELKDGDILADQLVEMTHLRSLSLSSCPTSDGKAIVEALSSCKNLRELVIDYCENLSLGDSIGCLTQLESLHLSDVQFSGVGLGKLTHLKHLTLHGCNSIPGELLTKELKNLNQLSLAFCTQISDEQLITITQSNPQLHELNLYGIDQISGEQLIKALAHIKEIKSLILPFTTGDELVAIAKSHPSLRDLYCDDTPLSIDQATEILNDLCLRLFSFINEDIPEENQAELARKFPKTKLYIL